MLTLSGAPYVCWLDVISVSPRHFQTIKRLEATSRALSFRISDTVCVGSKPDFRKTRWPSLVTRAGLSSTSLAIAFILPLTLLSVTIFAALRIGDRLDQKFLEELAINQAIREADEAEDGDSVIPTAEEPMRPRGRNRPKREV